MTGRLRWINAIAAQSAHMFCMILFAKHPAARPTPEAVEGAAIAAVDPPVPAAWPTNVSQLAQSIDACQRYDTVVCTGSLDRRPNSIVTPPAFRPDSRAKQAKERG